MGPYTTFPIQQLYPEHVDAAPACPSTTADADAIGEMLALLRRTQGQLRADPGVNAFLAVDAEIPLDDMDAATQSIQFASASNCIAFVIPYFGENFGVGMEVGAVLEDNHVDSERVVVAHEELVSSALLASITRRWEARLVTYQDERELVDELRRFIAEIMYREATGDLPQTEP